jgi:biuret amidohydrolase
MAAGVPVATDARTAPLAALPWAIDLPLATTALICIDLQHEFCSVGGWDSSAGLDISACASIVPGVRRLQHAARAAGMTVIHTREGHAPDLHDCPEWKLERSRRGGAAIGASGPLGRFMVRGEPGHAILDEVAPAAGEVVIDKTGKDAFIGTELGAELSQRGVTHLLFSGVTTECCVSSTLRTASDLGYCCTLVQDACASPVAAFHDGAIDVIREIFGFTASLDAVLSAIG